MPKSRISNRVVDDAAPAAANYIIWDDRLVGFGLKVTPAGKKIYIFQYRLARPGAADRTPPSRFTIGSHGSPWTPTTARDEASGLAIFVKQGIDPLLRRKEMIAAAEHQQLSEKEEAKRESELKFRLIAQRWLATLLSSGKSRGYHDTCRWVITSYLTPTLAEIPITQITPDDVQRALDTIPQEKQSTPLAVFDTAYAIFEWAKSSRAGRLVRLNVVAEVDRPNKPEGRKRVLNDDELAAVWLAAGELPLVWTAFFRLAILTGKRRAEIAEMRWSEIDHDRAEWLIPGNRTKNRNADLVSLSAPAMDILDALAAQRRDGLEANDSWPSEGYVLTNDGETHIGNHSRMKTTLDSKIAQIRDDIPIDDWVCHDLRRTVGTGMQRLGVPLDVIKAVLNHKIPTGAAKDYLHHQWFNEKLDARQRWTRHVLQAVATATSTNVLPLDPASRQRRKIGNG